MNLRLLLTSTILLLSLIIFRDSQAFMFWNQACSFNGSPVSYVAFKDSASIDITSSFTLECWISPVNSLNPSAQIIIEKRNGSQSNGYTLYLNNGRVAIRTNSSTRLIGKSVIQINTWSHIAGTFDAQFDRFSIYVNGVLDTSVVAENAEPVSNIDSLRIGRGNVNSPFAGWLDEVRIWSRALNAADIFKFRRTSLAASSGIYSLLALSLTFQDDESSGTDFSLTDWTQNNGTGRNNGVSPVDLSSRPSVTIAPNECIELDGVNDFLIANDNPDISPVNRITLEAWIFPRSPAGAQVIIQKGISGIDYCMRVTGNVLSAIVNNNTGFISGMTVNAAVWNHIAFSYDGTNGKYRFYINGIKVKEGFNFAGLINDGAGNLFIGSNSTFGNHFNGFIDEVRISGYEKSEIEIKKYLYTSIDQANEPNSAMINVVYNFDGYPYDNADSGPKINFISDAAFSHSSAIDNKPVSPVLRNDGRFFSDGFNILTSNVFISGTPGLTVDTLKVNLDTIISDINVFVAIEHKSEEILDIYLISPHGETLLLYDNQFLTQNSDNVITVFDDQADSSIMNNGRYVSFAPVIRPLNSLNAKFSGKNTSGLWKLLIFNTSSAETGSLCSWGIQFNNVSSKIPGLALRVFNEGFYRESDTCVADTLTVHLRESIAPFHDIGIIDETPDEDNITYINFPSAEFARTYYLEIEHRNSLETWSSIPVEFDFFSGNLDYDFTLNDSSAYGNNQIIVDNVPLRYAMFSGDIDQNDVIDLSDVVLAFNDAANFLSGYVVSDVNGDYLIDLSDIVITNNNANDFVAKITP